MNVADADAAECPTASARPRNPGARIETQLQRLPMRDGVEIAVRCVSPTGPAAATVILLHGYGMNASQYIPFAKLLATRGIAVAVLDRRGHGESGGERGHLDDPMGHADDLNECLTALSKLTLPLFVVAHSGGAAVLLRALPSLRTKLAGIALLAPTFANDPLLSRREPSAFERLDWLRYGVNARAPRMVRDNGREPVRFSMRGFLLSRFLGRGRQPVLTFPPSVPDGPAYSYTAAGWLGSVVENKDDVLSAVECPLLLATGEHDVFVNDAAVHSALSWMLRPDLPFTALSFEGADHFTTLLHAVRHLGIWIEAIRTGGVSR